MSVSNIALVVAWVVIVCLYTTNDPLFLVLAFIASGACLSATVAEETFKKLEVARRK